AILAGQEEARDGPRTQKRRERIAGDAAPVHLDREVVAPPLHAREKRRQLAHVRLSLREARIAGGFKEVINVVPEALNEQTRRGQAEQRNRRIRHPGPQSPQRRHRAEHIPQPRERPNYYYPPRRLVPNWAHAYCTSPF